MITMNHHPLHTNAWFAENETVHGRNVVVGNLVYSLVLGMSVPDVSGAAIANLEIETLQHKNPTFHGDTIYAETHVIETRESSKGDRGIVDRRDQGLQPGRRRGLLLPSQGDGLEARRCTDAPAALRRRRLGELSRIAEQGRVGRSRGRPPRGSRGVRLGGTDLRADPTRVRTCCHRRDQGAHAPRRHGARPGGGDRHPVGSAAPGRAVGPRASSPSRRCSSS